MTHNRFTAVLYTGYTLYLSHVHTEITNFVSHEFGLYRVEFIVQKLNFKLTIYYTTENS